MALFMMMFVVLLPAWLLGASVFHVAGMLIHLLLVVAIVSFILHFISERLGVA